MIAHDSKNLSYFSSVILHDHVEFFYLRLKFKTWKQSKNFEMEYFYLVSRNWVHTWNILMILNDI